MAWFTRKKSATIEAHDTAAVYAPSMEPPTQTPFKRDFRAAGQQRDEFIVDLVRRFGLLTSDLIVNRVALEQFEGLTSHHNILNRLKLLTERREIYNLGRTHSGHVVYGAKQARGSARRHVMHDLGVARCGISFEASAKERGVAFSEWCCDQATLHQELKQGERPCIPDARFMLAGFQNFLEYHTGSQDDEKRIVEKMRAYKKHHDQLKHIAKIDPTIATKLRVLFVCTKAQDAVRLNQIAQKEYGESMLYWCGWEGAYLRKPDAVLSPIWKVGSVGNNAPRHLLEARERE